ncbi:MAG: tetratricopeptide repeat protein [Janthinobacterium lividum]
MRCALLLAGLLLPVAALAQAPVSPPEPGGRMPNLAPSAPAPQPAPGAPVPKATLDTMLGALKVAPTDEVAEALEGQIRQTWSNQASPAVKLLLSRGAREMEEGAGGEAVDSFDAALDLEPDLLEAWRGRAQARLRIGDSTGAVRDIEEVLRREPRHFAAWEDLSRIAENRGDWQGALAAWQKALEVSPRTPGGQDRLRDLERRALGERA